jgi:hypothetical protein
MTRALDLTQRQVRALCEGAKKAGYEVVLSDLPSPHTPGKQSGEDHG